MVKCSYGNSLDLLRVASRLESTLNSMSADCAMTMDEATSDMLSARLGSRTKPHPNLVPASPSLLELRKNK